jgi:GTP-binding protein
MKRINRQEVHFQKGMATIEQTKKWIEEECQDLSGVCFIGRSNVGKSSLINALFGNKTAKVSQTPGKTREINIFSVEGRDIDSGDVTPFWLIDLPGYGYAKASKSVIKKWQELMNYFFQNAPKNLLMISMRDARHPDQESDQIFMEYLNDYDRPFVTVLNKLDKLKTQKDKSGLKRFSDDFKKKFGTKPFKVSAERRDNLQTLENYIIDHIEKN